MIQANCRDRFTAEDFQFVTQALGTTPETRVSLVELLTDVAARDLVLDHDRLADAILSGTGQLRISPRLYFYVLTRRVLRQADLDDRALADYLASLLEHFTRRVRLSASGGAAARGETYLSDLLIALRGADSTRTYLLRTEAANTALFQAGIFHEAVLHRAKRGAPDPWFYEEVGRASFQAAAGHPAARRSGLAELFALLAEEFRRIRRALNDLADRLLNLDDGGLVLPHQARGES